VIRATVRMVVQAGRESDFEKAWRAVAEQAGTAPGNLRQTLVRDEAPHTYLVVSDWVSRAAFRAFERSPEQDRLTAPLRALRESAEMSVHEIVVHFDGDWEEKQL
jgi:heme-degrading monooxygenase HmoA